jgi:hypothetical protein
MDPEKILMERITHELDMDLLREISKLAEVNLNKEIESAERKFNVKLERTINDMTNDNIHKIKNDERFDI